MTDPSNTVLPHAEEIHRISYQLFEQAKLFIRVSVTAEFMAICLAYKDSLEGNDSASWKLFLSFILIVGATLIRQYAAWRRDLGERYRKQSLNAVIFNDDCSSLILSDAKANKPRLHLPLKALAPSALNNYYNPTAAPGPERLKELYSQNAYFTWRLTNYSSWIYSIFSLVLFVAASAFIYNLIVTPPPPNAMNPRLSAVFSIILGFFWLRTLESAIVCWRSTYSLKSISDDLLASDEIKEEKQIWELCYAYDLETANDFYIPSVVYLLFYKSIVDDWNSLTR